MGLETGQSLNQFKDACHWHTQEACFCFQSEECLTLLKKLATSEAECVIERLTSWARLQLEDKEHISDEVATDVHITPVLLIQTCSNGLCVRHNQQEGLFHHYSCVLSNSVLFLIAQETSDGYSSGDGRSSKIPAKNSEM